MRTLVTGGAGFIGSNLVDLLLLNNHEVTVIDNESSDAHDNFYWNPFANNNKLDICDYENTRELYDGIDAVFHVAAEARIQPCIVNPLKAVRSNVVGTCTVLQCAREAGVGKVIYSSTSSAYGLANTPPLKEDMPTDCLNPYSVTKVAGEELCKMYYKLFGLKTIIFRYFNVYGERQPLKGQYAPVVGIFLRQKRNGEAMTIVGDGTQRRDFTHVSDVVSANLKALDVNGNVYYKSSDIAYRTWSFGGVLNVGTGINHSVNEIAKMIGGRTEFIPKRLGESNVTLADISMTNQILNWKPKVLLNEWIENNK
jgi:UDP-glucose 4-epimerase